MKKVIVLILVILGLVLATLVVKAQFVSKSNIGFRGTPSCIKYDKGELYNPFGSEKGWWQTEAEYHSYDMFFDGYYVRCAIEIGPGGSSTAKWTNN